MRKLCFQYFSDLHLERKWKIPKISQVSDNLLLAGDIGHPKDEIYQEFFKECSKKYERIFVVDGNHEWDCGKPDPERFQKLKLENVKLLENSHVELDDHVILGSTLWTETVKGWEFQKAVAYFTETLPKYEGKQIIVISHHLPTWHLIAKHYRENCSERKLGRYASHLDYFFHRAEAPVLWVCGHSHSIMNIKIGRTRCVINTRGETHSTKWCG
jgi:hypothetical protein